MNTNILALIDWGSGMWIMQYRDPTGSMITETTEFPACTPSLVVCGKLLRDRPGSRVFAKLS